jgi:single-stranded-DNA-specific exonuclease
MNDTVWLLSQIDARAEELAGELGIPVKIAQILVNRDITDAGEARNFLLGTLDDLHDPFLMQGMRRAADRLRSAVARGEKILIFGDYDVDGVLSVVILTRALKDLGARVDFYIPHRLEEGYGLKPSHIQIVEEKQADLVISADCGIKAVDFVREAARRRIDVIITDHHQPGDRLPEALTVLNPVLEASGYPDPGLAGIGVAFKLIQALFRGHPRESMLPHYLKLVSIATVADIAVLRRENRLFVKYGLQGLERPANPGLKSLLEVCGLEGKRVKVADIAFRIGPRINAAGRLGKADLAVQLFFSDSPQATRRLAADLDGMNEARQAVEKKIYTQALQRIQDRALHQRYRLLLLGCEEWHRGVIGIVASKLKEDFNRPVILFAYRDGNAFGSGRSIREFPLIECLNNQRRFFASYGGHPMAVGCELKQSDLIPFRAAMNAYAEDRISDDDLKRKIRIDTRLRFDEVNADFLDRLGQLSPFGVGNPRPVFITEEVEVASRPRLLKDRHIKLLLRQNGRIFEAIGWGKRGWMDLLSRGNRIHAVYTLQANRYLGEERLSLILEDIRPA